MPCLNLELLNLPLTSFILLFADVKLRSSEAVAVVGGWQVAQSKTLSLPGFMPKHQYLHQSTVWGLNSGLTVFFSLQMQ